ncbi:MAG: PAS domain S-box protein [Rhodospirillales bacterium]|nr:PAS domain S-box protein [Rhodospirillales bacterium]
MSGQRNRAKGNETKQDLVVIAGLSALGLFLVLIFDIPGRLRVSELIPYTLLWLALCFGGFAYRRWRQALSGSGENGVLRGDEHHYFGIGSWSWNVVEDKLVWSDEVYQIFGVTKENFEVSYRGFLKLVHPEDRLHVEECVAQSLRDNAGYVIDYRICTPGGDVRIIYEQGDVHFNNSRPVRMIGTITDVTERKHAETELKGRYDLLQSLIDAIPIPVYHTDENGIYEGCNKSFEVFSGTTKEQILGRTVADFMLSEFAKTQENMDKALFRQGGIQTYETDVISADGTRQDVIYHKAVRTKRDGSVGGLIGTILDISDRKRMEISLKESEQRFRNIAESASDWFWETDKKHRLSYLSDKVNDILDVSPETVLGKTRLELVGKDQIKENPLKWQQHEDDLNQHRPFRDLVYVFIPGGGSQRYISINGVPVFDDDGTFRGYRGTGTDITEHVRVEDALRESEERHRNFAADVAHELRTPLAVLRTHLDNLSDTKEIQSLRLDVDNMSRLVAQLLAMTRIETFTKGETFNDVDLGEVCRNVATLLAPMAIKEHRSIEVTGGMVPVIIRGNSASLEQAVRNLVENAIRYSARGTVITLNVANRNVPTVKVIDRGRGVAPEQREKIFQRFKRSDRRGGGAGLGLSIVKRTVNYHNGTIEIDDTPGGGATFIIKFSATNGDIRKIDVKNNETSIL